MQIDETTTRGEPAGGRRGAGFTLLEILAVVGIIALLMGLVTSSAVAARQRAYVAMATAETQQIAAAFRSYYMAFHEWPSGFGSGETSLTEDNMRPLFGHNAHKTPFFQAPPDKFEGDNREFLDPWGNPYRVRFDDIGELQADAVYEAAVSFPAQFGQYYQAY
ncbi:MAG: type II secretion system protein [Kiritimatiellae bacterium]|nr:type II secretion system protein [Kiritimatiellia bacterium]MBR1836866.1 type II secretion system protein [Kiritimatiellia bacterium]